MKRIMAFILILSLIMVMTACGETKDELKQEVKQLKTEKAQLTTDVNDLQDKLSETKTELADKSEQLKLVDHKLDGGDVKYILTLELKQSHFTLDLEQLAKDELNKTEFEVAVDKDFYDEQVVGEELVRKFRTASFVLGGTIGDWVVTVVDKKEVPID
jgi:chromosome segregation ATPase